MAAETGELRSNCPVNFGLENFGDKWSLLIVRDMVFWGKRSYADFLRSDERIATNILASRLEQLEANGIVTRSPDPEDRRKEVFRLTEKGIALIPLLVEIVAWSGQLPEWQLTAGAATPEQVRQVKRFASVKNRSKIAEEIKEIVRNGGYFFEGVEKV